MAKPSNRRAVRGGGRPAPRQHTRGDGRSRSLCVTLAVVTFATLLSYAPWLTSDHRPPGQCQRKYWAGVTPISRWNAATNALGDA